MKTLHFFKGNLQGSYVGPAFQVDEADIKGATAYQTDHATVEFECHATQGSSVTSYFVNVDEDVDTVLA
jgi:hypothetical protein